MSYRITYEQGNGYQCSCCRNTWTQTEDFEIEKEVINWIINLAADKEEPRYDDADDRKLISIEKEIGKNIRDQFIVSQEAVDHEVRNRQRNKQKEKKEAECAFTKARKNADIAKLKSLMKEYPDIVKENYNG